MKEREANRILEYLGIGSPHPSKGTPVRAPSGKAKARKTNKKQTKK